jgi:hypothetical protein
MCWLIVQPMTENMSVSSRPKRTDFSKFTVAELQSTEPEYERIPQTCRRFGVSRPFVFQAFQQGVKSLHIKRPGAKKGIRLVSVSSMREFLEKFEG